MPPLKTYTFCSIYMGRFGETTEVVIRAYNEEGAKAILSETVKAFEDFRLKN